jgi:hypothetical protein
MSLSSPTLQNPAEHYFEWKGGDGHIEFYNKETQARVTVPLPFEFIVLDQLNGVTGWSDQDTSGIWSNETRSTRDDFTVRTKKGVKYVGPYKNEQGISQVAGFGGKYTKIVYIAHKNKEGEYIMGRIGLTGAALNAWIDFTKAHSVTSGKIRVTGKREEKKGATTFQVPVFEWTAWTDDEYQSAVVLDKLLQNYLTQYLTAPKYDDNAESILEDSFNTDDGKASSEALADYEKRKQEAFKPSDTSLGRSKQLDDSDQDVYNRAAVDEIFNDEPPFSDDDVPLEYR